LLRIIDLGGNPEDTNYLFLGDYIDRGNFSVEVLLLLYSMKICFPEKIIMLRGNHESSQLAQFFNFESEVLSKFDADIFDLFIMSFNYLPLCCIMNEKFLAIHAGISPDFINLEDIKSLNRFDEPSKVGLFWYL